MTTPSLALTILALVLIGYGIASLLIRRGERETRVFDRRRPVR